MNHLSPYGTPETALSMAPRTLPSAGTEGERSLLQILWRRRRIVAIVTSACLLASVAYLLVAHPTYTAVSRLFIESVAGKKAGQDAADRSSFLYTQREVITSTPILAAALGEPGILDFQTFAKERDAITTLRNTLQVEVGKKDELVSVSLESRYPEEAKQIVAAVVNAYSRFQLTQRTAIVSDAIRTLDEEKQRIDKEISDRTVSLQAFTLEHRITGTTNEAADDESLKSIAAALTQARIDRIAATARFKELPPGTGESPAPETNSQPEDEAVVRQQLLAATSAVEALSAKFGPSSAVLYSARARVESLKRQQRAILESVKNAAVKKEADLEAYYAAEQRRHIEQRSFAAEASRMSLALQHLQERSDNLDGRLRDFKVNDEGKMANVAVLEPAHTDALPTGPKKLRILLVSLTAGIILGLIAAVVQDQLDLRLESVGQVSQLLGLTVVGYLPTLPMGIASAGRALSDSFKPTSALGVACQRVLEVLDTAKRPVPIKSLAITSPTRHDGRSTVACGLAVTFAQQGHRVLLVDTTEDSSLQAALLAATATLPALSNEAAFNEPASAFHAQKTTVSNLKFLSCGAVTKDTQQDPGSAVATVLEKAKGEFDLIIVDTPASSRSPMSRIAAAHCDSTLMVVRLSHTDYYAASRLRSDLYNVGADVLGVVLNQSQWELRPPTTSVVTTSSPGVTVSTLDPRAGNNAAPSATLPGERQAKVLLPIHS